MAASIRGPTPMSRKRPHKSSCCTESYAFWRSTNHTYRGRLCNMARSMKWRKAKMWWTVDFRGRNPAWVGLRRLCTSDQATSIEDDGVEAVERFTHGNGPVVGRIQQCNRQAIFLTWIRLSRMNTSLFWWVCARPRTDFSSINHFARLSGLPPRC